MGTTTLQEQIIFHGGLCFVISKSKENTHTKFKKQLFDPYRIQTTLLYESQWTSLIPTPYWSTSTS
jgi:hypothetical protein